jgi:PKD repeat protein
MAQLMKFYSYPAKGTGEHGYPHPRYGIQYANFGATYYTWNLMPDSLVAADNLTSTLIYHCGVAQDMAYGLLRSTSTTAALDTAMTKYFGYPSVATWKQQASFTVNEWRAMVQGELDAGHPLMFSGSNFNGTEQRFFICDGYQSGDIFHINWGSGGAFNGWFTLNNLRFDTTNFSFNQQAFFNLAPSPPTPSVITMDFETTPDFSLTFQPWTVADIDQHDTYGLEGITFPHQNEPMAFLSFNPETTVPSMGNDLSIQPHGGQRFGACFSSNPPANNDWFISPQVQLGVNGSFSFWIKSYSSTWGLDNYKVAISVTDNNPASFTVISGTQPLQTTIAWTKKVFNLASWNNQKVYIAIQCVSNDNFLMMIDDLEIIPDGSTMFSADFTANKTSLKMGESVNFTDQSVGGPTTWEWTFQGGTPGSSNLQNPTGIKYNSSGVFNVKLKITNGLQKDSLVKAGYIKVTGYPSSASLDFESLNDFTQDFNPWLLSDVGGGTTYGIQGVSFPGDYGQMAYICFNPSKTTPPLTNMQAHSGQKLGCSFSSIPPYNPNNKWLISPHLTLGADARIEFWVMTYNSNWGLEQFRVGVSTTTTNPADFSFVHITPENAPVSWTKKSYSLAGYAYQDVYIGIQCRTDNGFIFMIDDISITSTVGISSDNELNKTTIYPNPASGLVHVKPGARFNGVTSVSLVTLSGQTFRTWQFDSENDHLTLDLADISAGLYLLKIRDSASETVKKISVIH